jgi:transcription termination/antitermination protein NusA
VRLAAKLLGWKVDIKSEEEKRQEVESQMAALVVSGAPVSILADHGLTDKVIEKLIEAGTGTVEQLGAMTPEQLEDIPGIGPKTVEAIQVAVNSYYAQFEEQAAAPAEGEYAVEQAGPAEESALEPEATLEPETEPVVESVEETAVAAAPESAAATDGEEPEPGPDTAESPVERPV